MNVFGLISPFQSSFSHIGHYASIVVDLTLFTYGAGVIGTIIGSDLVINVKKRISRVIYFVCRYEYSNHSQKWLYKWLFNRWNGGSCPKPTQF